MRVWLRLLLRNYAAAFGAIIFVAVVVCAVAADWIAPYGYDEQDLFARLKPPAWQEGGSTAHLLGTDSLGRDVLSRVIHGARVSLQVALAVVALSSAIGALVGLLTGFYEGWVDSFLMRVADVILAFPFLLLAIALLAVVGSSTTNLIAALVLTGWVPYARLIRAEVLAAKQEEWVQAARTVGAGDARIMLLHIFPNVRASLIVLATLNFASVIIAESSLSFLGLGVQPPVPTWGGMLSEGRRYLMFAPWLTTIPGLAIALVVLSINFIGDWLRDVLDPKTDP